MTTTVDTHLQFSEDVKNEAVNNSAFNVFIKEIEKAVLEYGNITKVKTDIKLLLEDDWEIPNYTKIILLILFKSTPFETELSLWKELNDFVYKKINKMIDNCSEPLVKELKSLRKKFFIKLDLT